MFAVLLQCKYCMFASMCPFGILFCIHLTRFVLCIPMFAIFTMPFDSSLKWRDVCIFAHPVLSYTAEGSDALWCQQGQFIVFTSLRLHSNVAHLLKNKLPWLHCELQDTLLTGSFSVSFTYITSGCLREFYASYCFGEIFVGIFSSYLKELVYQSFIKGAVKLIGPHWPNNLLLQEFFRILQV